MARDLNSIVFKSWISVWIEKITQCFAVRIVYFIIFSRDKHWSIIFHWGRHFGQFFQWEGGLNGSVRRGCLRLLSQCEILPLYHPCLISQLMKATHTPSCNNCTVHLSLRQYGQFRVKEIIYLVTFKFCKLVHRVIPLTFDLRRESLSLS